MDPLRNPFNPTAGGQPPALVGRDPILDRAKVALARTRMGRQDRSSLLIGLRGVGKTVLLNRCFELADKEDFQTVWFEAIEESSLAEVLVPAVRQILLRLDLRQGAADKLQKALGAVRARAGAYAFAGALRFFFTLGWRVFFCGV